MADNNTNVNENSTEGSADNSENPTPPAGSEGNAQPQGQQQADNGGTDEGDTKDSHGQPGINKERHDREMAEKDAKIAELEKQIADVASSKERADNLQKEIDNLKKEQADSKVTHKLEMAGCVDVKAAKARLDDFKGDVTKLKEACPYLFGTAKQTGSTGGKPAGAAKGDIDDKLDRAFGLKK